MVLPVNTLFKICFVLLSVGCSSAELETKSSTDSQGVEWSFDTWGDDCSNEVGGHPCNFSLENQEGNVVSLYDFFETPVVLDFSAMWCGPCQYAAIEINDIVSEFPEISYLTVLIDNEYGEPPTQEDLQKWSTIFEISEPVLGGNREMISSNPGFGWDITAWPTFYYINDEMIIEHTHAGYSGTTVRQNINQLVKD